MALLTLRNNLNGFWDFYYATKVGAGSPKGPDQCCRTIEFSLIFRLMARRIALCSTPE
jgi:hypothetical protein